MAMKWRETRHMGGIQVVRIWLERYDLRFGASVWSAIIYIVTVDEKFKVVCLGILKSKSYYIYVLVWSLNLVYFKYLKPLQAILRIQ